MEAGFEKVLNCIPFQTSWQSIVLKDIMESIHGDKNTGQEARNLPESSFRHKLPLRT